MNRLLIAIAMLLACSQAYAVNNRVFVFNQPTALPGTPPPAGYRAYCGIGTNDPATFSKTPVKDQPATTVTVDIQMPVALADNITFCQVRAYAPGGLEGGDSNVVSVRAPGPVFIKVTEIKYFDAVSHKYLQGEQYAELIDSLPPSPYFPLTGVILTPVGPLNSLITDETQ